MYKDFILNKNGSLIYEPKNLVVVPPKGAQTVLEQFYNEPDALGKGQNNWYRMINQHVLGIKKREAIEFLKSKEVYQLTRHPNKDSRSYQIFAIHLVDVARYKKENNRYIFILTCIDLFGGYTWFEPLQNKESKDVTEAFKRILLETDKNLPNSKVLSMFFYGMKHIVTKSYTSQPNLEAANKQLRKIMRELFVRTEKLVWYSSLKNIQNAKNT